MWYIINALLLSVLFKCAARDNAKVIIIYYAKKFYFMQRPWRLHNLASSFLKYANCKSSNLQSEKTWESEFQMVDKASVYLLWMTKQKLADEHVVTAKV